VLDDRLDVVEERRRDVHPLHEALQLDQLARVQARLERGDQVAPLDALEQRALGVAVGIAELDRFQMRLSIGYPASEDEAAVLREDPGTSALRALAPVLLPADVLRLRASAQRIKFDDALIAYLLAIVNETREHEGIHMGASTRAALALRRAAQAHALLDERDYAIPEDVRELAVDVLAHRIAVQPRAGAGCGGEEAQWLLREILDRVPVPL